uniref:Synaptotagmin-3 n=1 Tax=Hemiscolopendra marginata TaxID=943146 RepID=A0A646QI75_9MYRI
MLILSPWSKLIILFCGALFVALTIIVVVCLVSPFCPLHRLLPANARLPYETVDKKKKKKSNGSIYAGEPVELTKLNTIAQYDYGSPLSSFVNADNGPKSPPPSTIHGHRRLYTIDSSYSSMSPTTEAGSRPHSPTSTLVDDDAQSVSSPPSLNSSEIIPILYGTLCVSFRYETKEDSNVGRMIINLIEARALTGREYHASSCDPFVKIVLLKLRTRLRRSRSHYMTLSEFQSQTVRHSKCPYFGQTFAVELTKSDMKDCALKFIVFDRDKYANPTELGEAVIPLNDIQLNEVSESEPITFELQESKQNNGELLLGLSYLPTSERLSIHVIRAVNLKYETIANNIDVLNLEVRILLLHNGKMIKKKKTPPVARTNNPSFDHTLAFDVPTAQLDHVIFLIGVAHKAEAISESDDGLLDKTTRHDCFIGKVILGSCVTSSAVHHWQAMLHCPRQQVTSWHVLR